MNAVYGRPPQLCIISHSNILDCPPPVFWQFFWIPLTKDPLESEYCGVAPRWCGLLYCNPNHIAATSNHSNGFLIVSHPASAHIVCVLHVCVLLHWNLGVVWAVTKSTWAIQGQQLLKSGKVVHVVLEYEKFNLQKTFISFLGKLFCVFISTKYKTKPTVNTELQICFC